MTIRTGSDTFVSSTHPSTEYGSADRLLVDSGSAYGLTYFSVLPAVPRGATVTSATLRIRQFRAWPGTRTMLVRTVQEAWKATRANWNNKPAAAGLPVSSVTKTGSGDGDAWDFDVTADVQAIVNGARNFGWRLSTDDTTPRYVRGFTAAAWKPILIVDYAVTPDPPGDLSPAFGAVSVDKPVLQFGYSATLALSSVQVQIDPAGNFTAPAWDSGEVATTSAQLDLASFINARTASVTTTVASTAVTAPAGTFSTQLDVGMSITGTGIPAGATVASVQSDTAATLSVAASAAGTVNATITRRYLGLAVGASTQWRARVRNAMGWSPWSSAVTFSRVAKPPLAITNPPAAPNNVLNDGTPPIIWTFPGQAAYRALLRDPAGTIVDDSGWTPGAATEWTPTRGATRSGQTYWVEVRTRDAVVREATPGDPDHAYARADFTFEFSATVAGPATLDVTQDPPAPWVDLRWTDTALPDSWAIVRDGEVIARLERADVPNNTWTDWTAAPNRQHTWRIARVVNGRLSAGGPTVTMTPTVKGVWLADPADSTRQVQLVGTDDLSFNATDDAAVYNPIGASASVRVVSGIRGPEGSGAGILYDAYGRTALAQDAALNAIKANPATPVRLVTADLNIPATVGNIVIGARRHGTNQTKIVKTVAFDFWQQPGPEMPFTVVL
ncbi:MAG: DNRLRE domain-containing protein [Mycobacteriales bacterium]